MNSCNSRRNSTTVSPLASTDAAQLQLAIDVAVDLFARVGMQMNASKTKAMVGHNGALRLQLSTPAYKRRLSGEGLSYREAKRRKVTCPHCDKEMQESLLGRHVHSQHNDLNRPAKRRRLLEESSRPPRTYYTYSPSYRHPLDCPVPGCVGRAASRDALRNHFCHRHPYDCIIIMPEGRLPKCPQCGLQVNLTVSHRESRRCQLGRVRKRKRELEIGQLRALESTAFKVADSVLENVETFLYLGRVVTATTQDWPAVARNITRARKRWGRFSMLLRREGASPRVSGLFYKAVVMSALLYACETWVISKPILKALEGFHHRAARGIARMPFRYFPDEDRWERPPVANVLERAGLHSMDTYLSRRRRYLERYAATLPLIDQCRALSQAGLGGSKRKLWWMETSVHVGQNGPQTPPGTPSP